MPHKSKKDKVERTLNIFFKRSNHVGLVVLYLILLIDYSFDQESSKAGRSKKSGGKNGPTDNQDVSIL